MRSNQVKATAGNVDEAVRELPDANLVRYTYFFFNVSVLLKASSVNIAFADFGLY